MLGCQPLAGTGALWAPQRPFGPNLKICEGHTYGHIYGHTYYIKILYIACKQAFGLPAPQTPFLANPDNFVMDRTTVRLRYIDDKSWSRQ